MIYNSKNEKISLHDMWDRRHATKFNGVSYPVQKAAEAVYSDEGKIQVKEQIDYYLNNAGIIRKAVKTLEFDFIGGVHSPYIWINGKDKNSWDFSICF